MLERRYELLQELRRWPFRYLWLIIIIIIIFILWIYFLYCDVLCTTNCFSRYRHWSILHRHDTTQCRVYLNSSVKTRRLTMFSDLLLEAFKIAARKALMLWHVMTKRQVASTSCCHVRCERSLKDVWHLLLQENPKMNNLRDYYERALEVFGTSDEGKLS